MITEFIDTLFAINIAFKLTTLFLLIYLRYLVGYFVLLNAPRNMNSFYILF